MTENQETERTVFISGLPYQSNQEEIEEFFKDCGKIEHIKLPKYQDTGRLLGYGHLVFVDGKSVQKALDKNGQTLGTRYVTVQKARGSKSQQPENDQDPPEECRSVFVKNLPYEISAEEIGDAFRHCGPIENVRMVYNNSKNHFKGFCYIDFKKTDAVKVALKMRGKQIGDRTIFVDFETGQPKQGFKYNESQYETKKYNKDIQEIQHKKIKKERQKQKVDNIKNFARTQKDEQIKRNKEQKF